MFGVTNRISNMFFNYQVFLLIANSNREVATWKIGWWNIHIKITHYECSE